MRYLKYRASRQVAIPKVVDVDTSWRIAESKGDIASYRKSASAPHVITCGQLTLAIDLMAPESDPVPMKQA